MRYLITSALPYINGIKHLGNLVGSMLPADVYARFLRMQGHDVLFICGTDEHGTPAEIAAQEANMAVKDYCDKMFTLQKETYDGFNLSFDYFGRSSSTANHALTQSIFEALDKNGFIEEKSMQQFYSIEDDRFLPDRYVIGTCPFCNYDKARGDQCDGCGKLLDPTSLVNPRSSISNSANLELRSSKHLFLKLQDLEGDLKQWIDTHDDWPSMTKGIAYKWLNEGLRERCITRDLKWGIKVPKKGYEDKVFYVWFDAPIAYIAMTQEATADWAQWWKNGEDVSYSQFMAKDNVPFHAIFFPAMLMASRQDWHLVDFLKSVSWLNYEGGKFSTSQNRGIFLDEALKLYPSDYWRYFLMANIPETSDTDFSLKDFTQTVNKDLADVLGNLVSRTFSLVHRYFEGNVHYTVDAEILDKVAQFRQAFEKDMYALSFRQAMSKLRALWAFGNEYIASTQPWTILKTDKPRGEAILSNALYIIQESAKLASCIIPDSAQKIQDALLLEDDAWHVNKIGILFLKLDA